MPEYNIDAVRNRRIRAGIAGTAMAETMDLGFPTYYKKEKGQIKWTLAEGKFLADFFGTTIEELFLTKKSHKMRLPARRYY